MLKGGAPITDDRELVLVQNDPNFNEMQPKPLVPYSTIYGVAAPATLPYLPNDGSQHVELPAGRQFGLIGTASFCKRDTTPGGADPNGPYNGLDPFNTAQNDGKPNWFTQGADAGKYSNADIYAVRIVGLEGVAHRSFGPGATGGSPGFRSTRK